MPVHVRWMTDAEFRDDIHVHISNLSTGDEVRAELTRSGDNNPYSSSTMHDPYLLVSSESGAITFGTTSAYRGFQTVVRFESGGCYTAQASWPGGSWSATIAVGK